ncbi:hypothetical protein TsFJ059_000736 [Trichoderma semiorbis]|uniref:Uncharacterized protein n=1 Tax=Trichoderma semiorbis TaxID=1491008 RepID=A0A9P8KZ61_9HYPO|nr:hypothetical protein TsFJ059_000736 [Trichoderma semiorbis]
MKDTNRASQATIKRASRVRQVNKHIINQDHRWGIITSNSRALFPVKDNTRLDKANILAITNIHKASTCTLRVNTLKASTLNNTPLKAIMGIGVQVERPAVFSVV